MPNLSDLSIGQTAYIQDVSQLTYDIRKKLMVMGFLPNTPITLIRKAPLGDPLQFEVRGVSIALRQKIAQSILISSSLNTPQIIDGAQSINLSQSFETVQKMEEV